MALLQITEPGEAAAAKQRARRFAVGIDLGTTNSLVALVGGGGKPEALPDSEGETILPSAVYFGQDATLVGRAALARSGEDGANVLLSTKRLMGRAAAEVGGDYRYHYAPGEGMVKIQTARGAVSPVQAAAEILKALRVRAEAAAQAAGGELFGAVITVPAYFDDAQRQATKDAAALAGLKVLRLLNEPTAAAVAYGLDLADEGVYAVFDLGGGTFDVSILRLRRGVFEVLATGGDTALGGDDFDRALARRALAKAGVADDLPDSDWRTLAAAARRTKEDLSAGESAALSCRLAAGELSVRLGRDELEAETAPLLRRTLRLTKRALADAGVEPAEVAGIVLVGGATRMPRVAAAVGEMFGRPPFVDLDPDRVVALGAAAQADALANGGGWLLLDVIPLSLGVETMGGLAEKIIPRNAPIPAAKAQEFTTYQDGQSAMIIHVVQGERELVADCRSLARFTLSGIPPLAAGAARIRVSFTVDADGLLTVAAGEKTTGAQAKVEVKPSYGLSDSEIAAMLEDSRSHAAADVRARLLAERKTDAAQLAEITRAALAQDGGALLSGGERQTIEEKIQALTNAAAGDDPEAIRRAIKDLDAAAADFAARRMDAGIKRALAGRAVDEI